MSWLNGEVWLEAEVLWFREQPGPSVGGALAVSGGAAERLELPHFGPVATGLAASRQRRLAAQAARRRRLATRTIPAVALVLGSATMLPIGALRHRNGGPDSGPLPADPPSLTFRFEAFRFTPPEPPSPKADAQARARSTETVRVEWHRATSVGLPYSGRLVEGTRLPVEGPDWVTWNPSTDSSPNLPDRLYGHERTIRATLAVLAGYRAAHEHAPRVVVGDISHPRGGTMREHVSHQNGLDVDVYYPRLDRRLGAPLRTDQIDRALAQALLDRFVAAGAKVVFVGYSTGLRGPTGVIVPYPNHENHMHVRFPAPPG